MRKTLIRSLNKNPSSMGYAARYPDAVGIESQSLNTEKLLQTAERCRERLSEMNLVVELSPYD